MTAVALVIVHLGAAAWFLWAAVMLLRSRRAVARDAQITAFHKARSAEIVPLRGMPVARRIFDDAEGRN